MLAGAILFAGAVRFFAFPEKRQESLGVVLMGSGAIVMTWPHLAGISTRVLYTLCGTLLIGAGWVFLLRSRRSDVQGVDDDPKELDT
jgi:hypothetical protein